MSNQSKTGDLKRSLSLRDLIVYGMIYMMPIAPMGIYGYVISEGQGMTALAYLIGTIAMWFTALSYARMSGAYPVAGSVYAYATRAIGPRTGFLVGWLLLLDYVMIPALCYVVAASVLAGMTGLSTWLWLLAFIAFNTTINIVGINIAARVNNLFAAGQMIILLWFVVFGLYLVFGGKLGQVSFTPFYNPQTFSPTVVMSAVSLAALSFLGFDAISTLAEESTGQKNQVGRAMIIVLFMMGGLFVLQTWIAGMAWPDLVSLQADKDNAFYLVAGAVGGPSLKAACAVATAVSWGFSAALAAQTAVSRILFSMSRDGLLPAALSRVHPRFQTPYISTLFVAAVSLVVCAVFMGKVDILTSLVNFGALSAFFVLHLCVLNQYQRRTPSSRWLRDGIVPVLGLVIIGYIWISLASQALEAGVIWLTAGILYYAFIRRRKLEVSLSEV